MGKYFGFPDCCVKNFCETDVRLPSPFDGTGYVPCECCNKMIVSDQIKQDFILGINSRRYHNQLFDQDDSIENNPNFFKIMEEFYNANNVFPYEDILDRGGQNYIFNKFLGKDFSFKIFLTHKHTKESLVIDLYQHFSSRDFPWIFNDFVFGNLTANKKQSLLEDLNLEQDYSIHHKATKKSINDYFEEVGLAFKNAIHIMNEEKNHIHTKNNNKTAQI